MKKYIVKYRMDPTEEAQEESFSGPGPAYAFAYKVEVDGGIAMVVVAYDNSAIPIVHRLKENDDDFESK